MDQPEANERVQAGVTPGDRPAQDLDAIHHVAISVGNIQEAVDWYTEQFKCRVQYQDDTWAMLLFANIRLALLAEDRHPPHVGLVRPDAEKFGPLRPHRDGTSSIYLRDPAGNAVEVLAEKGLMKPRESDALVGSGE
jgi:catechol 2,3-dioxygenase-like lactoylglutathione lyase family enzyme